MARYTASHLKDMNRLTVYNLIRERVEVTRTEIARATGISAPTVMKIIEYLTKNGFVTETGVATEGLGRKPQIYSYNKDRYYSICAIHEGDDMRIGIVNLDGEMIGFKKMRAPKPLSEALGSALYTVIDELIEASGVQKDQFLGIGIGIPGIYDPLTYTVSTAPLIGVPDSLSIEGLLHDLKARYGLDVVVENDLNMEVQGEYHALGLREDLVYISLGTGLGSGVMLDGELRRGRNNMCGEIGYLTLSRDGDWTDKRQPGWLEKQINLSRLKEKYHIADGEEIPDEIRREAIEYVSDYLALCVNNVAMCYDCGHVAFGGEVFDLLGSGLFLAVREKAAALCMTEVQLTQKVLKEPGIAGAALMVYKEQIERVLLGGDV